MPIILNLELDIRYKMNRFISILVLTLLVLSACDPDSCLEKGATEEIRELSVSYFERLRIEGTYLVILVQDSTDYVEFEAPEGVLDHLKAEVNDSVLVLTNSNDCSYRRDFRKPKAYIHFTDLKNIDLFEVCKLTSEVAIKNTMRITVQTEIAEIDLKFDSPHISFYNNTTTGGIYTFRGNCKYANISGYYSAQFNLDELYVNELHLNNSSLSDMTVHASDLLKVEIHHQGDVYYDGSPKVIVESITGSGKLIHIDE